MCIRPQFFPIMLVLELQGKYCTIFPFHSIICFHSVKENEHKNMDLLYFPIMETCCRDAHLVKKIGAATALEVRATGMNYAFSPCIAVWNQFQESFPGQQV